MKVSTLREVMWIGNLEGRGSGSKRRRRTGNTKHQAWSGLHTRSLIDLLRLTHS